MSTHGLKPSASVIQRDARTTTATSMSRVTDLFHRWRSPLCRYLAGKAGVRPSDVDDVAQEVFLRLIRYERCELIENPQAYLYRMATNVVAEWAIRARYRRPHDSKWLTSLVGDEALDEKILHSQSQTEVARALDTLTPHQRLVLKLYFHDELGHGEIAERLGESLRSVRRTIEKSYAKLRKELDPNLLGVMSRGPT